MKRFLSSISIFFLFVTLGYSANRVTTWGSGQVLTHTALNAEYDNIYAGDISRTGGYWGSNDDIPLYLGSSQDAQLEWETTQTNDALMLGLSGSLSLIVTEKADMATNYGLSVRTDPALIIHSADAATVNDYLELQHNQTDAVVNAGAGGFSLQAAGTEITDVTATGDWVFKGTTPTLTVGDAGEEDAAVVFDGNAYDFHIGLDDTGDSLVIGEGTALGTNSRIAINGPNNSITFSSTTYANATFSAKSTVILGDNADDTITMTGSIQGTNALLFEGTTVDGFETIFAITDPTLADKTVTFQAATGTVALLGFGTQTGTMDLTTIDAATSILLGGTDINTGATLSNVAYLDQANVFTADQEINGTTPTLIIGDGGAEDTAVLFDDATYDYHFGVDNSAGALIIGSGSALGTTPLVKFKTLGTEVELMANTQIGNSVTVDVVEIVAAIKNANALWFDGATDDTIETIFAITDPTTTDKTITFPDLTGTVALLDSTSVFTTVISHASAIEGALLDVTTSGLGGLLVVESTAADGYAGTRLKNDAQEWSIQVRTSDTLAIQDITDLAALAIEITAGTQAVSITQNLTVGGTLTVGAYTLPATDGTAGQYLTTNGSGVLTWTSP